jgi:hypothetical protein
MSYTPKIKALNASADDNKLGVRLGRLCIAASIPVAIVCRELDVSKAAIYRWFAGRVEINKHLRPKVEAYYSRLSLTTAPGCRE